MVSRIFWVMIAGLALFTGMVVQNDVQLFGSDDQTSVTKSADGSIEAQVERAIDRGVEHIRITQGDRELVVSPEAKRALVAAVGRLAEAEAELAVAGIGKSEPGELAAAKARRDQARAEVETLKATMVDHEQAIAGERDSLRDEIKANARDEVRDAVRDAARN